MEITCINSTLTLENDYVFISPYNFKIPIYQIKEFGNLAPCKHIDGMIHLTLYDFLGCDKSFFIYIYKGEDNHEMAQKISQIIFDYEIKIDNEESFDFLNTDGFVDVREKKAYIKHLSILNTKVKIEYMVSSSFHS